MCGWTNCCDEGAVLLMFKFSVKISCKLHNWSQQCLWAHGLFGDSFCEWILKFFLVFLVLSHLKRSSTSADTQPALKHECHSKTAVWLKECSPEALRSISGVLVVYLPNSCKTWCRHVARFCHPSQMKRNTKSKKHSCKNSAYLQSGVT
jgi:hypothetical protein